MAQLDICEVCGKKTKFMFTCPHCKKSLCMKHRRSSEHDCDVLVEEPITPPAEEIVEPLVGSLGPPEQEIEPIIEEMQVPEQITEPEKEIMEPVEDIKIITDEVIQPIPEHFFDQIESPELRVDQEPKIQKTKSEDLGETIEEEHIYSYETDINESEEELTIETEQLENDEQEKTYRIVKILTFSSLVLLTIVSISLNGYLYFKVDADRNMLLEEYNMLAEKNSLIEHQYNELYLEYEYIKEQYELANESYIELEKKLNESKGYENYIQLEEMRQITIPPNSNAVFFYEIPSAGYITVEYYSDVEVYVMVGSTLLDEVYYSRNPQGLLKSSELKFSVPVTPDINILIENTNRENSATVFFGIDYYGQ